MITTTGVLVLSPEALIIRLISVDPWTILVWRGCGMAIGLTVIYWLGWARGGLAQGFAAVGPAGLLAAVLFASDNVLFVTAVTNTSVANTLLILACASLFAALFSRVLLRESVPARTWMTIGTVSLGVVVIFGGSLGHGRLLGDLAALGAALSISGTFVVLRRSRASNMMPAMALGALIAALAVLPLAEPGLPPGRDLALLALSGFVVLPVAFGLITLGPRYLPAAEVSLLMLLETVFGAVWVWLALREVPATLTFLGGALVLGALVTNTTLALRRAPVAT